MINENNFTEIKKLGFEVFAHERDGINGVKKIISKNTIPSIEDLVSLFRTIKHKYIIEFWDASHRQISDPGAYCTGVVLNDNVVVFMEGNHGWSSEWKVIDIIDFAKFTQQNWDQDIDRGEFFNCIIIEDNKYNLPKL